MNQIDEKAPVPVLKSGLARRCPRCGQGALFTGYLTLADSCGVCGLDFTPYQQGDGPAFFVMFLTGGLITPLALALNGAVAWPTWVYLAVVLTVMMAMIIALLPPAKAMLVALQYRHDAAEGRLVPRTPDDD